MIARDDNIPDNHTIKKYSKYRSMKQRLKKLLEQVSDVIHLKHYSYKTEKSDINRFIYPALACNTP
jgi:hypothetical protein